MRPESLESSKKGGFEGQPIPPRASIGIRGPPEGCKALQRQNKPPGAFNFTPLEHRAPSGGVKISGGSEINQNTVFWGVAERPLGWMVAAVPPHANKKTNVVQCNLHLLRYSIFRKCKSTLGNNGLKREFSDTLNGKLLTYYYYLSSRD